jgi:hypothetical protein
MNFQYEYTKDWYRRHGARTTYNSHFKTGGSENTKIYLDKSMKDLIQLWP